MPIRFRCAYCNQLMGIARRKAGTVVTCPNPKCGGQVVVPSADSLPADTASAPSVPDIAPSVGTRTAPPQPAAAASPAAPPIFERSDFDEVLKEPLASRPVPAPAQAPAAPPGGPWVVQADPHPPSPVSVPQPGAVASEVPPGAVIVLTPGKAAVAAIAVVLLLAIAFGVGVVVGRFVIGP